MISFSGPPTQKHRILFELICKHQSRNDQYSLLEPWDITEHQRQLTDVRNMTFHRSNDVASENVTLPQRIEHDVVEGAVVAFRQISVRFTA